VNVDKPQHQVGGCGVRVHGSNGLELGGRGASLNFKPLLVVGIIVPV
jgi:hypothetical protein